MMDSAMDASILQWESGEVVQRFSLCLLYETLGLCLS